MFSLPGNGVPLKVFMLFSCLLPILSHTLAMEDINANLVSATKANMNPEENPCENFYGYSCGGWKSNGLYYDTVGKLDHLYAEQIGQLIRGGINSTKMEVKEIFGKLQDFYESCKEHETRPVHNTPTRYLSVVKPTDRDNWPRRGTVWQPKDNWNVWSTMGRLAAYGFNNLFFDFDFGQMINTSYVIHLRRLEHNTALYYAIADQGKDLETFIQEIAVSPRTASEPMEMSISELSQKVDDFDFQAYLSAVLGHDNFGHIKFTLDDLEYFRNLAKVIKSTSPDIVIRTIRTAFLYYMKEESPWMKKCVHILRNAIPLAVDYVYEAEIYRHDKEHIAPVIEKVFRTLQDKFVDIVQEHREEFSPQEIDALKEKIVKMKLAIGSWPNGMDDQSLVEYYSSWMVVKGNFHQNHLNLLKHKHSTAPQLHKKSRFLPAFLNKTLPTAPSYLPWSNTVTIPYAYIRFPMVHPKFHELFLYAELGNSLGYEMTEAFNTDGLGFGLTAGVSLSDKPKYLAALECLKRTKTNNMDARIADLTGFRLAYETFFQQSVVPQFSGDTEFSNKQLFFIKFAQLFCAQRGLSFGGDNDHPADRIETVVVNSPEFEEVFSCPANTQTKCKVW